MFTFSISDLDSDLARVRMRIRDTAADAPIFQDEEVLAFISMEGNWRRAAALALETIASQQILLLKVITLLDVRTDGATVAKELRSEAQQLREQSRQAEDETGDAFDVIEMVTNDFTYRERIHDEWLRGNL